MTTASASPVTMADLSSNGVTYTSNNNSPYHEPSASQSVASTSSVTLDEPNTGHSASNTATPGPSVKLTVDMGSTIEGEDEDAKLLASLAEDISKGISSTASLAGLDETAICSIKAEALDSLPMKEEGDGNFTGVTEDASGPIQAYAKLEFPGFSYYIQTLDCTIGRRPAHMRTPALRDGETQHITGAKKMEGDVDVDLGLLKSISRLHVRIFYQDQPRQNGLYAELSDGYNNRDFDQETGQGGNLGRFVLQVLGRNGCFVDDVPVERDAIVPLGKRTKIQIAERVFYFVLPPVPLVKSYNSDGELGSGESLDESDEDSGSLGSSEEDEEDEESSGSSSSEEEDSEEKEYSDSVNGADVKKRPKLVLKRKPVASSAAGKGKGKQQGKTIWAGKGIASGKRKKEEEEEEESEVEVEEVRGNKAAGKGTSKKAKASAASKEKEGPTNGEVTGRKRKRGSGTDQEQSLALKVGTPIGVETLNLKSKKKKKVVNGEGVDAGKDQSTTAPGKGNGKGGGKAHIVAAALAAKAKADEEKVKGQTTIPSSTNKVMAASSTSTTPLVSSTNASIRPMGSNPARPNIQAPGTLSSARPPDMSRPMQSNVRPAATGPGGPLSYRPPGVVTGQRPFPGMQQGTSSAVRPTGAGILAPGSMTPAPFPPSSAAFAHLASQNRPPPPASPQPLPPAGPGIKPELSNIDLVREALANPISLSRGGKLTLQEIYEDISSKHEWYRNNNRSNGRDWHSSIRHAVGNSKEMVRIPKRPNEQGKGVFYAFSSSEAAKAFRSDEQNYGALPAQIGSSASPTPPVVSATAPPTAAVAPRPPPIIAPPPPRPAPLPQAPAPAAPRPPPQIQPNSRVTIVIGKAPAEALAQMAAVPKAGLTKSIETLFKGPPIVHHEGKLYLNPVVFGHMSASEVNDIGGKGAQQALALLQGQLLKHLQTLMPQKGSQSASPQPARPPTAAATGSGTASSPSPRPPPPANGISLLVAPRPPVTANRPMQVRPGVPSSQGPNQTVRPTPPGLGRPLPPGVPSAVRPVSNGVPRPMVRPGSAPLVSRPLQPQSRPPIMANGQLVAPRPMPPLNMAPRPPIGQGTSMPSAPRPPTVGAVPRPVWVAPSSTAAQTPLQRPMQTMPRPAPPAPRPQPTPSSSAGSAPPSSTVAPSSSGSSPARTSAAPAPSSNAMMSAMQALASHPDAAGLMTLLSGGKVESGAKLTPGQLDLLQRAGRIAAEQQKAQQKKSDTATPSSPSPAAPTSQ